MQIKLSIPSRQPIIIEFLDNPFVNEFVEHFLQVNQLYNFYQFNERVPYLYNSDWDPEDGSPELRTKYEKALIEPITAINKLVTTDLAVGTKFPVPIEDIIIDPKSPETRKLLNKLHRYFTTACSEIWLNSQQFPLVECFWERGTLLKFQVPRDRYDEFEHYVHQINDAVHSIENHMTNDRMEKFPISYEYQIVYDVAMPKDPLNTLKNYFLDIKNEHYEYSSDSDEYDVWVPGHQILGKAYWDGYFSYDNPKHWDISEMKQYSGSFGIGKRRHGCDPNLIQWLGEYGISYNKMHCGIPLGKIVSGWDSVDWLHTQPMTLGNAISSIDVVPSTPAAWGEATINLE